MKKITVISTTFLALAFLFLPKAFGHNANCHSGHCHKARPTTDRIFSFDQYNYLREIERRERIRINRGNKFTFWRNYQDQIKKPFTERGYFLYKDSHSSFYPRINNVRPQPHKIAVRETAYHQNYSWDSLKRTHELDNRNKFFAEYGDGYTINLPIGFSKTNNNDYYYPKHDLTVSFSRENNIQCDGLSFQLCASREASLARSLFGEVKNLSQKFGLKPAILNGEKVFFPTYRESFIANYDGVEKVYFFYTTMNPVNKNVVNLNAITLGKKKFAATNIIEEIFRTIKL